MIFYQNLTKTTIQWIDMILVLHSNEKKCLTFLKKMTQKQP